MNKLKTKTLFSIAIILIFCLSAHAELKIKPTFQSCGIYLTSTDKKECKLFYKKANENIWRSAFPPVYDNVNKEYRGSIVKLEEDTRYNIKLELYNNGTLANEYNSDFHTWTSSPKISKILNISSFKNKNNDSYDIDKVVGKENGWIKIVGDKEVDALNTDREYAISITNSQYLILENINIKGGLKHGIFIPNTSSQIRIINCDISNWGRIGIQNEQGLFFDKNGEKINNDAGIRLEHNENIVVERCYIHDPKGNTNSWAGVIESGPFKGKAYEKTHPAGPNAIYVRQAHGGIVICYNDLIGNQTHRYNDALETSPNGAVDGGLNKDADVYGNVFAFGQDDGIELDGGQCNVRFYNNRVEQTYCGISTAPNRKGPSYIFNNVISNLGDGTGRQGVAVKNGGGITYTKGIQYLFNNTMLVLKNGMTGVGYGNDEQREMFIAKTRNNIFMSTTKPVVNGSKGSGISILDIYKSLWNDFDYDMIANAQTPDGKGLILAKQGSEAHGTFALPQFTDIKHGVFTLKNTDPGIDKGQSVNNFMDVYEGASPDLGAFELGSSSLYPMRPIDIEADKYQLKMTAGKVEIIKLKIGRLDEESSFRIAKSDEMDWLTVHCNSKTIKPDSEIILSVEAVKKNTRQVGMFFVRLENGFSIPISVTVE